jgi:hypothetical protein
MLVYCFTLEIKNNIDVDIIYNSFGTNIPNYHKINNNQYLFCVDKNINIKNICDNYKCQIINLFSMDINEYEYNNLYKIQFNYIINEDPYELVQIKTKI